PGSPRTPEQPAEETIDLGVALRLVGVNNPTVSLARERVREALAGQLAARSLLLPTVNVGGNYRYHSGPLQDDPGEFRRVNLQSLYLGFGAGAVGANPAAVPGVRLFAHLGDAVYEPLAARQRVAARRSDAQAVQNQILLDAAVAYLELVGAEARLDILRRAEAEVSEIARVTAELARARVRQEQVRPFVPTVSVGYSAGLFGGGGSLANSTFGPLSTRSDFDVVAVWNVQNLGLGNRARARVADAVAGQAVAGYDAAL